MKNLKIAIVTVIAVLLTAVKSFAAPMPAPAPAIATPACSVYTADNKLVINNTASQQLDVVITGNNGREVYRNKVRSTESISLKKLDQGKYNISIKDGNKEQRVKLTIL